MQPSILKLKASPDRPSSQRSFRKLRSDNGPRQSLEPCHEIVPGESCRRHAASHSVLLERQTWRPTADHDENGCGSTEIVIAVIRGCFLAKDA